MRPPSNANEHGRAPPNERGSVQRSQPVAGREPSETEIRERAFQIYQARGSNESGHELEDWQRAERELRERKIRN